MEEAIEVAEDVTRPLDPEVTMEMLRPRFAYRLGRFMQFLWDSGSDVRLVEGFRTKRRQGYLYSIGRTVNKGAAVVTHTLRSLHMQGRAMDVCSASLGYSDRRLFEMISSHAWEFGLRTVPGDRGHLEEVI